MTINFAHDSYRVEPENESFCHIPFTLSIDLIQLPSFPNTLFSFLVLQDLQILKSLLKGRGHQKEVRYMLRLILCCMWCIKHSVDRPSNITMTIFLKQKKVDRDIGMQLTMKPYLSNVTTVSCITMTQALMKNLIHNEILDGWRNSHTQKT